MSDPEGRGTAPIEVTIPGVALAVPNLHVVTIDTTDDGKNGPPAFLPLYKEPVWKPGLPTKDEESCRETLKNRA